MVINGSRVCRPAVHKRLFAQPVCARRTCKFPLSFSAESFDRGPFTCTAQTDSNELVVTRKRGKSSITEGGENPTHFAAAADSHPPESFYNRGFRSLRGASPVQVRWKMFNMPGNHVADCVAKNLNIFVFADEGIPKAFQSLLRWGSPEFWAPFECSSFKSPGFSTF